MELETGVYFSIYGESYAEVGNPTKLWRDFAQLDGIYAHKHGQYLDESTLIEHIRHTVQKKVYDASSFGKRNLEVNIRRKPYVKIKSAKFPGHDQTHESFYMYGGDTTFYVNTTPQLIYPSNLFDTLKIPSKDTAVFLGQDIPEARFFYPQSYDRIDESYKSERIFDIKVLNPNVPLRILDYYPYPADWLTHQRIYVSQFKPTDIVVDYNLNQIYPVVKNKDEELLELKRLLLKKDEPIVLNGVQRTR